MANLSRDLTIDVGWKDDKLDRGTKRSAASMRQLGREIERSQREIDRINRQIIREEEKLQQQRIQQQERVRAAAEHTGQVLVGVGAGVLAATSAAVKAAIDWETAWTGVTKTVDGTPQQMAALEGQLRQLAKTLPASHQEIAAVAEAAGQLGIQRGSIATFTKTMIDLGNTTNLTADEAATSIAQIANIMGTSQSNVDRFGAALVALGNDGASTEAEILEMTKRLAGAGQLIGASETDVLALANAMASIGISAEAGGGSMSRVMQKIYESVVEGGDAVEGFARVAGMSAKEFSEAFRKDPVGAINSFIRGLNGVEASGGNVVGVLKDLGIRSSEDLRTVLGLKGATDLLSESLRTGEQAWKNNSALTDEANKRYATAASQIEIAWNKIKDAAITVGGAVAPAIGGIADVVGDLVGWFQQLPKPVQEALGWLAGIGGTIAVASGAMLLALPRIRDTRDALRDLGITGDKTKGKLGAIGRAAGIAGVGLTGLTFALDAVFSRAGELNPQIDALGVGLTKWSTSGKLGGEALRVFGDDLNGLNDALRLVTEGGFGGWSRSFSENVLSTLTPFQGELGEARETVQTFDRALADLARNGQGPEAMLILGEAARLAGMSVKDLKAVLPEYGAALEVTSKSAHDSKPASDAAAAGMEGIAGAADSAATETEDLREQLEQLVGPAMATEEAAIRWKDAIAATAEALAENGRNLDINTEKGRLNRQALLDMIQAAQTHIGTMLDEGRNYGEVRAKGEEYRQKLIETAIQFGMNREEARKYIDRLFQIPPKRDTKPNFNKKEADKKVTDYKNHIGSIPPYVKTTAQFDTRDAGQKLRDLYDSLLTLPSPGGNQKKNAPRLPIPTTGNADGGLKFFANGRENHIAQIAKPGEWRVWAEPETQGEAYIPLARSKRRRSMSILEEVAARFGYDLIKMANGGMVQAEDGSWVPESFYDSMPGHLRGGGGRRAPGRDSVASGGGGWQQDKDLERLQEAAAKALEELLRLNEDGLQPLVPSLQEVGVAAGTDTVTAIQALNKTLPVVAQATMLSGKSMQSTWQANAIASDLAIRQITGPQFGALQGGLGAVRQGFANTANSIRDSWSRIRGHTAEPVRFALSGPINNGIVDAWNSLNRFFAMNKPMRDVPINFADGGIREDHTAQIARAGAMRLWAEPETGGEAYIPLSRAKRRRSTGILGEVADRFGYELTPKDIAMFADGGLWRSMWGIVRRQFPGASLNSAYRPGDPGYHGAGKAVDVGGPMGAVNRWLAARFPQSTELIYTPGINLWHGRSHTYSAGVRADHYDHVHWAMQNAGLLGGDRGGYFGAVDTFDFRGYLEEQFKGARNQVRSMDDRNRIALAAKTMASKAVDGAIAHANQQMSAVTAGAGAGVERWRGVGLRALAIAGQPASEIGRLLMQMDSESGGNPRAVNRWDINWQLGHPSAGLMQVIGPTYQAYKHPQFDMGPYMYGTSVNPLSNILASIRYSLARYGSLAAAWRGTGYDTGGLLGDKQVAVNLSGRKERILSPQQTESFEQLVRILDTRRGVPSMPARAVPDSAAGPGLAHGSAGGPMRISGQLELVDRNGVLIGRMRDVAVQEMGDEFAFRGAMSGAY
ncbi:phage tail tape measure protein [Prauserella coralliicola]|nr:phage tail tape measure protein [Prauserella coralliicola]